MNFTTNGNDGNNNISFPTIIFLLISFISLVLNLLAIRVLVKSTKLRTHKFTCLSLYLSVSNLTTSFMCIITGVHTIILTLHNIDIPYVCFVSTLVISICTSCSLVQVFFICLERYLAMQSVSKRKRGTHSLTCVYVIPIIGIILYNSIIFTSTGRTNSTSCNLVKIFAENFWIYQLSSISCRLSTYLLIVIVYVIVLIRLRRGIHMLNHERGISEQPAVSANNLSVRHHCHSCKRYHQPDVKRQFSSVRLNRIKRSMVTLGLILLVETVSVLPTLITNIVFVSTMDMKLLRVTEYTNILVLVNALADPIIYTLCIKEYRTELKC